MSTSSLMLYCVDPTILFEPDPRVAACAFVIVRLKR